MKNILKKLTIYTQLLLLPTAIIAQNIGTKVSIVGVDGKTYSGVIEDVQGTKYKIKYDGYNFESWLVKNQFSVFNTNSPSIQTNNLIGEKVTFPGTDGRTYTGIIKEFRGNKYRVKYDGYDFQDWLVREQFTIFNPATVNTSAIAVTSSGTIFKYTGTADAAGLKNIFEFGQQKGWASPVYVNKFNAFLNKLANDDIKKVVVFLQQANTSSARFFALKSLLTGDSYAVVQKFIGQLNQYPESYQQEHCLVTNERSIIQQWEFSCSVTTLQTYLADLSPRYAWEVKQIPDFDAAANNPNNPMAEQQKLLLEKYGGVASARGDYSGKPIGITDALNELVGHILGVSFYAQQVTEPLPGVLQKIRNTLDKGIDEPLLIGFVGTQARHFILTMRYRYTASGYQYLIYDPWDGKCDYVNESSILQGSLSPLLTQWRISIDYYYPVQ